MLAGIEYKNLDNVFFLIFGYNVIALKDLRPNYTIFHTILISKCMIMIVNSKLLKFLYLY